MLFLAYACVPFYVGALAQTWKGRTGVAWGFLSLFPMLLGALLFQLAIVSDQQSFERFDAQTLSLTKLLIAGGGTMLLMTAIIATVPNRRTN